MKDGIGEVAVRARQPLPKDGAGNLHVESIAPGSVQPRGLEPCRIGVDADPGLDPIEKFVPGIHSFALTPNLSCSRHRWKKKPLRNFHSCEKAVESRSVCVFASGFGILARAGTANFAPVAPPAPPLDLAPPVLPPSHTGGS